MRYAAKNVVQGTALKRLSLGSWTILVVLLALFGATMFVAYLGWRLGDDADVPITGYVAMAMGVILSLAVGFGLMALVFFSSRRGYDDPPTLLRQINSDTD